MTKRPPKPKSQPKSKARQPNRPEKPSRRGDAPRSNTPVHVGDLIEVDLVDMAQGGTAIARHQGRVVFVAYAIPGERVQARITRADDKVLYAEGVMLLNASGDRVLPRCQHFGPGRCRNCHWQHIAYEAQPLLKYDIIADQLARLGGFDDPTLEKALRPALPAPEQWGYLTRATLEIINGKVGYLRTDGRNLEPLILCEILHPELQALYESLDADFPDATRLHLARGSDGAMMLMLELKGEDVPELAADFPVSVNVILAQNEPMNLVGDTALHYVIGGRTLRATAGSFFRANLGQIEPTIQTVLNLLQLKPEDNVLDLYAGVGIFSVFAAPRAGHVTLIESYPPAATDAEENLKDFENIDIIEGSVEEVLASLIEAEATYSAAIIDPPGTGLSDDARTHLLKIAPRRIVYISSNPATLARDGKALAQRGYRLTRVQPIDTLPQTYYAETVCLFERKQ